MHCFFNKSSYHLREHLTLVQIVTINTLKLLIAVKPLLSPRLHDSASLTCPSFLIKILNKLPYINPQTLTQTKYQMLPVIFCNPPSKCPGTLYPGDFPGEKSVPGQAVKRNTGLPRETWAANRRTLERNLRKYFNVERVPR